MGRYVTLFASLLLLIGSASAQFPQNRNEDLQNTSTVTVTVQKNGGAPLADAHVVVSSIGTRSVVASGYTNTMGVAEIGNVPSGVYEVIASKGVDQTTERLEVSNTDVQVALKISTDADTGAGNSHSVSVAQMRVPNKAREQMKKAHEAVDKRKLEDAAKYVAKALEIAPDFSEALVMRGLLRLESGQAEDAKNDFDAAIKADSGNSMAYFAMGAALNREQLYERAAQVLDRGIATSPNSWQGYYELAKAQIGKGDYEASLRSLDRALDFAKDKYPPIHLLKGHALLAVRQYENAMAELQAFLMKAPLDANAGAAQKMLSQAKAFVAQH